MLIQVLIATLLSADLTGVWTGNAAPSFTVTLTLQQSGESISGTEQFANRVFPVENAVLDNANLTFTIPVPAGGRLHHSPESATLQNDELHLHEAGSDIILKRVKPDPEAARIERLAAVIRLWGAIRFFHPYVADRPIDWDTALLAAIQPVETAVTANDFATAISKMLSVLEDPETRILSPNEPEPPPIPCQCRALVRAGYFDGTPSASAPYYVDWENVGKRAAYIMRLPNGIRVAIRTAEPATAIPANIKVIDDRHDGNPSREMRLLALARYWNTIHYFEGYPDLLEAWDSALAEFIPQFEKAQTTRDYLVVISRLAARTHDGHAITKLNSEFGAIPAVNLQEIAGQTAVTGSGVPELRAGDIITSVAGEPVADRVRYLSELFPSSTPWYATRLADRYLLAGPEPRVKVGVRRTDGKEEVVEFNRIGSVAVVHPTLVTPGSFGKLPSGLGYIDLTRLVSSEIDRAFDSLMDTPGLILDMRGYPNGTFAGVAARLTDHPVPAALIRLRVWHGPDPAAVTDDVSIQQAFPSGKPIYRGRIAVLIDTRAFSQSEHMCLYLEAATRGPNPAVFVGTPTSGTDGEVTHVVLPGQAGGNFSGESISHADGRPLQRVGIIPDVWAEPTLRGIQEGRDEVLDAAINALTHK